MSQDIVERLKRLVQSDLMVDDEYIDEIASFALAEIISLRERVKELEITDALSVSLEVSDLRERVKEQDEIIACHRLVAHLSALPTTKPEG